MVQVTKHGAARVRERVGVKKAGIEKNATKAYEQGITHKEALGGLRRYLDMLYLSHGCASAIRIYHYHVYLFSGRKLITVLDLPKKYWKTYEKIKERKE